LPDINNLREKRFIWAHSFVGFSPWWVGSITLDLWPGRTSWWWEPVEEKAVLMADRKQRVRKELGTG
jgi:hypothetical protein